MEEGRSDRDIDPDAVARLAAGARRLFPALEAAEVEARAGVRAATPDGLPLVGPGDGEGEFIARGARRNGWLLAPLIAEVLLDRLAGRPISAAARAFDPGRFKAG
jgi:glycine oxidase